MTHPFDTLIIGAGIIGMLTARELAAAGQRVLILDKGEVGQESSWAGGGILSPLYPWRYDPAVSRLARWGHEHYPHICDELRQVSGIDPEWQQSGLLILGDEEFDAAREWAAAFDMQMVHWPASSVREAEPDLHWDDAALWLPSVAQVRNPRLVKALHGYLEERGVAIETGVEVQGFATRQGRIQGVKTRQGTFEAPRVVLCSGAWSAGLLPQLPVEPVKGQMLVFAAQPGLVDKIVLHEGRYLIPRRDGHILAGSTLEYTGFNKETTAEARETLLQTAYRLYPQLQDYPVERHWAGLRPGSPQGIPIIGEHPQIAGLFINTGHFRNGVIIGAASARLAADQILAREPILDDAAYALRPQGDAANG